MNDLPMKKCTGPCKQEYPTTPEYWHRNKNIKDGLESRCKKCKNQMIRNYYKKPDVQEKRKAYYSQPEIQEREKAYREKYKKQASAKEREREWRKERLKLPKVQERNKNYNKEYYSRPDVKERYRAHYHNRQARKKSIPGTYTPEQIQDLLKRQKHKCYYCQKQLQKVKNKYIYQVDHTFPISRVVGTDIPANSIDYLVVTCPECNLSKRDKFPWEWPEGGRLL